MRTGKTKAVWIIFGCVLALALISVAASAEAPMGPEYVHFQAKMGEVMFSHERHGDLVPECVICHHKGVAAGKCRNCHLETQGEAPKAKDMFHKLCKSCHTLQGGPTQCRECHKK